MGSLNEKERRDFVTQMIALGEETKTRLQEKHYDAESRLQELADKKGKCDKAEIAQQEASAAAQIATKLSNETLDAAYKDASEFVELVTGLLGKDDELVKKMKKFRKN